MRVDELITYMNFQPLKANVLNADIMWWDERAEWPKLPKMRYILVLGVYLMVFDLTMPCPSKGDAYRVDELLFDKKGIVLDMGGEAIVPDRREHGEG